MSPRFLASLVLAACSAACSKEEPSPADPDAGAALNAVPEWDKTVTAPADDVAQKQREACGYAAGSLPAQTQGQSHPMGKDIPVDTIVIVMMENRSFDHYFQKAKEHGLADVDVAPPDFANPDKDGNSVAIHRDTQLCFLDTAHGWEAVHDQVGGADKMDGFVRTNDGRHEIPLNGPPDMNSGARAMGYYDKPDLPFMYYLAEQFALGDRYFCSVLGPTWPNRMFLYASNSFGRVSNKFPEGVEQTIFDQLEKRGVSWKIYAGGTPGAGVFVKQFLQYREEHVAFSGDEFFADAAAGKLPQVVFLDPKLASEGFASNDEHPPAIMQIGQEWLARVTKTMIESPQWSRSAMFLTYDEHGGLYDHVPPPKACEPDARPAELAGARFDRYGIRVPFAVISPFAKKRFVGHRVYDHTSIVRFVQARFTLPAMSKRDANAEAPWEMFDFAGAPNGKPTLPPAVPIDEAQKAQCATWYAR